MADDMPHVTDRHRVLRLAMMCDEARRAGKGFKTNDHSLIRDTISAEEFYACGGAKSDKKTYQLYRQIVYARRDADAYSKRDTFPKAEAVKRANDLYEFYPSDCEDVDVLDDTTSKISHKD